MAFFFPRDKNSAQSLFERIRSVDTPRSEKKATDKLTAQITSIRQHLLNVLNTRQGNCRSAPDLGLTDLNDASQTIADLRGGLTEAIRLCICQYEPRLDNVHVTVEYDAVHEETGFQVTAQVQSGSRKQAVLFRIFTRDQQHYQIH